MSFKEKRIAVIGGGLGGLSFMNSALYAGLTNIHLYEAAPEFTEVGAGVNITRNANRVLDAFGLSSAMRHMSSVDPPSYMEYHHYRTGAFLGRIEEFGEPRSRQIHRAHLVEVLKSKVPDTYISTGKRLAKIERAAGGEDAYVLHFADGTTATADIIVGCDGIKSAVRAHLGFTDQPIYSGQMVYRGYVAYSDLTPSTASLLRRTVNFRGPRRHILTLPIGNSASRTDRVGIIGFMTEPLEGWKSESWLATAPVDDLAAHVEDWCPEVQEIIEGLRKSANQDGEILKQTLYVREPTEKWWSVGDQAKGSGIILIGDSVHSTLPHQGQGACQAIESGFALAQILSLYPHPSLSSAFQLFQDLRKPRTDRITRSSYETGKMASADIPEEQWAGAFAPDVVRERMRWVMEYDLLGEVERGLGRGGEGEKGERRGEESFVSVL
ncbi:salicylate hydroxylase [Melanomma pulvis-pyrius CBS 109.77]|uniref:Salicylate hydroxylase n=1 Tax=Melanomma pulvis-pyrius CBS 109.77 TaxID=1314802 RepID=A0A6A6XK91_9PLEO|nr:salicylate hydroxylase [Melanomma pulvis-pyrius CBS 109.77]